MKKLFVLSLLLFLPTALCAQEKPSSAEAKKVMDYYFSGQGGGAVLMEYKLCTEISKEGETKNDCITDFSGTTVEKGQTVFLWMNFMVPSGDKADIILEFMRNGKVRGIKELDLNGTIRYRINRKILTDKTGNWKIKIVEEVGDQEINHGGLEYTVVEPGAAVTEK